MLRRFVKITSWFLGSLLALAVVAYAVLFVANLEDRPPIPEIAILNSLQEDSSPVARDDNSYLFMLGFTGPPDVDPLRLGFERQQWMKIAAPEFDNTDDPLGDGYSFQSQRSDAVSELATTCKTSEAECLRLLESNADLVDQWLAEEQWLLARYRSLIDMTAFDEATPFEILAPLPPYGAIGEGQRLHIAVAWRSAAESDAAAVSAALEQDLAYWRMVLEHSDILITKMVATAAIIRHFKLGNIVLRQLPENAMSTGIPPSWRREISNAERSVRRSLAGEWMFFEESTRRIEADTTTPFGVGTEVADTTLSARIAWVLLAPFWQPQDVSNRHAKLLFDLITIFDVPYEEIPDAVDIADERQASTNGPFSRLYNFTGDLVMSANYWTFSDYAVRVSDLEGIRRAALLAAELRATGVEREGVAQRIIVSDIVDPYTNEPFTWNDDSKTVVFDGLEPHERSRHEFIY